MFMSMKGCNHITQSYSVALLCYAVPKNSLSQVIL